MRTKTDAKQAEVVAAAVAVFTERGYDGTSMEDIRVHAGCSKGTLYSYFSSKDELFLRALLDATRQEATGLVWEPSGDESSIEASLLAFGFSFLETLYSPRFQALRRLAFSAPNSEVGSSVYNLVVKPYVHRMADVLAAAMDDGKLRRANPQVAANHLGSLLESELLLKFLFRVVDAPSRKTLQSAASRAVAVFLAAYGTKLSQT